MTTPDLPTLVSRARAEADEKCVNAFDVRNARVGTATIHLDDDWLSAFATALLRESEAEGERLRAELADAVKRAEQAERDSNFANECADKWARKLTDAKTALREAESRAASAGREALTKCADDAEGAGFKSDAIRIRVYRDREYPAVPPKVGAAGTRRVTVQGVDWMFSGNQYRIVSEGVGFGLSRPTLLQVLVWHHEPVTATEYAALLALALDTPSAGADL